MSQIIPSQPVVEPASTVTTVADVTKRSSSRLLGFIPTVLTFGLLGAVGAYGHHSGWKLPKPSELRDGATAETRNEWCAEHNVPEAVCVECNSKLMPRTEKPRWCKEHGVSECPTCHPELAQVTGTAKLPQYDTVEAINRFDRLENNSRCRKFLRRIQFASKEAFDKSEIDVDLVTERPMIEALRLNGALGYDQSRIAHLSTRSAGSVWRVFKQLGDSVNANVVLALIDAAEVGKLKSELGRSVVHLQLKKRTLDSLKGAAAAVPEKQIREAESAYEESQINVTLATQALINLGFAVPDGLLKQDAQQLTRTLQCLGLPAQLCEQLAKNGTMTMNLIPIVAPQDGMLVEMDVVAGEVVHPERPLITLADLGRLWLTLHVRQEDADRVSLGQKVTFTPEGGRREVVGQISFVSPTVDEATRTIKVRAVLDNSSGTLRANSFGSGQIVLREEPKAVTVPLEALQSDGDCQIVFVRDKDFLKKDSLKVFHARQVRVGAQNETHVELLAGILPGEVVATKGSASLRAELLKSAFGEGCCGGHGHGHEH